MSRRQAREIALQALYQLDFNPIDATADLDEACDKVIEAALEVTGTLRTRDTEFVQYLVTGTMANLSAIDEMIAEFSKDWKVSRMASIDRNITRMAIFELQFPEEKVTPSIVISEAVELAKKFGTDESSKFVNGILGAIVRK